MSMIRHGMECGDCRKSVAAALKRHGFKASSESDYFERARPVNEPSVYALAAKLGAHVEKFGTALWYLTLPGLRLTVSRFSACVADARTVERRDAFVADELA